jgi:ABC-2 type transport system ATP-binding protein
MSCGRPSYISNRMDDAPAVLVEHLRVVRRRREVIHDVSFIAHRGSITGLLGPSGCGKSTLLRSVVGVQIVAGGTVTVLGLRAGSPMLRRRIGYATQTAAIYADLTVAENLRYFAAVVGAPASDVGRVIIAAGLASHAHQVSAQLSTGELSRASLAVALLGSPELLVLDEPTASLDPVLRGNLWDLFYDLAKDGVTLLISSHVMDEAARCQELLLMREGRFLATGTPDALRQQTGEQDLEQAFLHLIEDKRGVTV